MQKVQDKMQAEVQEWCRGCRGGAGRVQGRCRWCRGCAGYLHRLHLSKHNIRCREVQGVQAHLSMFLSPYRPKPLGGLCRHVLPLSLMFFMRTWNLFAQLQCIVWGTMVRSNVARVCGCNHNQYYFTYVLICVPGIRGKYKVC